MTAEYKAEWQRKNKDKVNAASRRYRLANPEKRRAVVQAWRKANPDKVKAHRKREYQTHGAAIDAKKLLWGKTNPDKLRAIQTKRRARLCAAPLNDFTAEQWTELKQKHNNRCAYCLQSAKLTQDHIQPLSKGGAHTLSNILPACQSCNSSKGTKPVSDFLQGLQSTQ